MQPTPAAPSVAAVPSQNVANQITAAASHNVNVCMLKHGHIIPIVAVLLCLFISSIVTVQREIAFLAGVHNDTAVAPTAQPPTQVPAPTTAIPTPLTPIPAPTPPVPVPTTAAPVPAVITTPSPPPSPTTTSAQT